MRRLGWLALLLVVALLARAAAAEPITIGAIVGAISMVSSVISIIITVIKIIVYYTLFVAISFWIVRFIGVPFVQWVDLVSLLRRIVDFGNACAAAGPNATDIATIPSWT